MFNNAVLGLKFLKNSYSTYATIQHTIDYYIIILMQKNTNILTKMNVNTIDIEKITNTIMNNDNIQSTNICNNNTANASNTSNASNSLSDDKTLIQTRDIHKFLYELWNQREINIVINLYKELETKQKGAEREYIYKNIMQ